MHKKLVKLDLKAVPELYVVENEVSLQMQMMMTFKQAVCCVWEGL